MVAVLVLVIFYHVEAYQFYLIKDKISSMKIIVQKILILMIAFGF